MSPGGKDLLGAAPPSHFP